MWSGIKKVAKPLGGVLKSVAKKALPFVGSALGSFIPIPGVGTAIGGALGSAVSKALEVEYGELESEEAEFEMARRFVRIAATAAQNAGAAPSDGGYRVGRRQPGRRSARPASIFRAPISVPWAPAPQPLSGRWYRRGADIVVVGA